jgi:DNA invertase Pin-like site-specific DNA recombinase/chaperonin cofactor prefoldin
MLENFVTEKGWNVYRAYIDDDVTGTTFQRPGFQVMMSDIEHGNINLVITKDLSRLGRNYIEAGRHRELFNEYGVRYIAVHDNHDSKDDDTYNISTPIKEIMNEMYAAEVSRKVRATKTLMANQGKFANSRAPYGYKKSVESKHVLVVDEDVSQNIIRMFELYLGGKTARAIADVFNRENIPTANEYYYNTIGKPNPYKNNKNKWGSATIMQIIKNPVYYGAMANGKRKVVSFKNHSVVKQNFDDWIIVEDTHAPLVNKELWLEAQQLNRKNNTQAVRRRSTEEREVSIFAGIIKCTDCGGNLVYSRKNLKSGGATEFYRCSTYVQKGKNVCPPHRVDYNTLYQVVLASVQEYAVLAVEDEKKLIDEVLKASDEFKHKNVQRYERSIRESKNRIKEIDGILQNLYEDKISGEVIADIFKRMSKKYSEEQAKLIAEVEQLEAELDECKQVEKDLSGWINRIKECITIDGLTRAIVVELIDRIDVSEIYNVDGERNLDISISYKFDRFNLPSNPQKGKELA